MAEQLFLPIEPAGARVPTAPRGSPQSQSASNGSIASRSHDSAARDAEAVFARVFRRLSVKRPEPEFRVEYFPYAGVRSKITVQDAGHVEVSISDLLADAPALVREALAEILLSRVFGRRPSREARECYKAFVMKPAMRQRADQARRERGFKLLLPPQGRFFNLEEIFNDLNHRYFEGQLSVSEVGWSLTPSRTILGHYDSAHRTITISRRFDQVFVPRYLVEYLVFHEMLHIRYPVERNGHRRVVHSRAFLEAERKFPMLERAREQLKLMNRARLQ